MAIDWAVFLTCIALLEDAGDPPKRGDAGEVGIYQITQAYLDDANEYLGTTYTLDQVEKNVPIAKAVIMGYMRRWGGHYRQHFPHLQKWNAKIAARMHNGGDKGWGKQSTRDYGNRFMNLYTEKLKEK